MPNTLIPTAAVRLMAFALRDMAGVTRTLVALPMTPDGRFNVTDMVALGTSDAAVGDNLTRFLEHCEQKYVSPAAAPSDAG